MILIIVAIILNFIEGGIDHFIVLNKPKKVTPEWYSNNSEWHRLSATYYVIVCMTFVGLKYIDLSNLSLIMEAKAVAMFSLLLAIRWLVFDATINFLLGKGAFFVGTTSDMDKMLRKYAVKFGIQASTLSKALKLISIVSLLDAPSLSTTVS